MCSLSDIICTAAWAHDCTHSACDALLNWVQETEKARWDEQRKTMQQDAQAKAQLAQYEDELARKRNDAEHQKNRERNQELVIMQEESNRKQQSEKRRIQEQIEGERRATEQYKVTPGKL